MWHRDLEIAPTRSDLEAWLRDARQMNLTDPTFQHGILMLEQLLEDVDTKMKGETCS